MTTIDALEHTSLQEPGLGTEPTAWSPSAAREAIRREVAPGWLGSQEDRFSPLLAANRNRILERVEAYLYSPQAFRRACMAAIGRTVRL